MQGSGWRFAFYAAALSVLLCACRMPWQSDGGSCAEGARLDMPVDMSAFAGSGRMWPFGVHGGAHPEGHPGIDLMLDATNAQGEIAVKASFTATILSITPETEFPGNSCIVMDSACVEVNLCHVALDPALKVGGKVARGQRLGAVGLIAASGRYELHFGTYSGSDADLACPADFLDPDSVECRLGLSAGGKAPARCGYAAGAGTILGRSEYPERSERTLSVSCADGSKQTFARPVETALCSERLSPADRARMNACLGSACAGVW